MNKRNIFHLGFAPMAMVAISLVFVACSDPADKTQDAQVNEPQTAASSAVAPESAKVYALTDASDVEFTGSKIISGSHDGGFKTVTGKIKVTDGQIFADGPITIDMNSIWSDNQKLTGHLKNQDFFEVESYPTSSFTITGVEKTDTGHSVTGNLEMHGVTKSITFDADIAVSEAEVTVKAEFDIDRQLWGVDYKGKGDNLINDKVIIRLNIVAAPEQA